MPKKGKKGNKKNSTSVACSDVKLEDYANSSKSVSVRRKPLVNSFAREVKNLYTVEKSLYEQYGYDFEDSESDEKNVQNAEKRKSHSKVASLTQANELTGCHYPIDLWFLISKYIQPEDIKVFSSICKASHLVCQSYSFWINIYKRYYNPTVQLPSRLQPHCIEIPVSLKASVVRALYRFYPRFVNQLPAQSSSQELYQLIKCHCLSMWRTQKNGKWFFYFKFQSSHVRHIPDSEEDEPNTWTHRLVTDYNDPRLLLRDVNLNPDEGCRILQVVSPHFVAAPLVMGSHLADLRVNLTGDMTRQKLQLFFRFSSYNQQAKNGTYTGSRECGGNGELVKFDPVESMSVFNWWHPQYPTTVNF